MVLPTLKNNTTFPSMMDNTARTPAKEISLHSNDRLSSGASKTSSKFFGCNCPQYVSGKVSKLANTFFSLGGRLGAIAAIRPG